MKNELQLLREGRPNVEPLTVEVAQSARSELMASITGETAGTPSRTMRLARKPLARVALVSLCVLATAAAGWAVIPRGGNLPDAPFAGVSWELTVGEESNGDGSFKVCRSFKPRGEDLQMGNSLGGAGCETSPVRAPAGDVIDDLIVAFNTGSGGVLLVDLTKRPVSKVVIQTDTGESHQVAPFAMPKSGEQFVAVELRTNATEISVRAYDDERSVGSRVFRDLAP